MRPLVIELFCGRFGWSKGFVSEGYRSMGFDIVHEDYHGPVPEHCELVLQDVLTLHGSQFRDAAAIVASPPCQAYSYRAMPWKRAKALAPPSNELFDACFRIQLEASDAAGRYIPMVVENVKGAQPWVGRAKWHYGSFYLWGDVPALMPFARAQAKYVMDDMKNAQRRDVPGIFKDGIVVKPDAVKGRGNTWFGVSHGVEFPQNGNNPVRGNNEWETAGIKQHGSGAVWFDQGIAGVSSRSSARKAASAAIAEIPFDLAQHIARCFKPSDLRNHVERPSHCAVP